MIRNNQNRRRRGGNNNGPRPQQMNGGNNYGNRLDNRQRGNASQLLEKYRALARDAQQVGDRVTAEYYLQYADHYYRVLGDYRDKTPDANRARRDSFDDDSAGYGGNDDSDIGDDEDGDDRGPERSDPRGSERSDPRGNERSDARGNERSDARGNDRDNWRDDAPVPARESSRDQNRDRPRDGQRETRRDYEGRDARDNGQRDYRRDGGARDGGTEERAPRMTRDAEPPRADSGRAPGERGNRRERPAAPRAAFAEPVSEGPIPGLPGPATLRIRTADVEMPEPPVTPAFVETAPAAEAEAPRRRGRPRKAVSDEVDS